MTQVGTEGHYNPPIKPILRFTRSSYPVPVPVSTTLGLTLFMSPSYICGANRADGRPSRFQPARQVGPQQRFQPDGRPGRLQPVPNGPVWLEPLFKLGLHTWFQSVAAGAVL